MEEMMNKMELWDHKEDNVDKNLPDDLPQEMLRFMSTVNLTSSKRRSWFTSNQIKVLKNNLAKFPDHQATVRKFLKIQ